MMEILKTETLRLYNSEILRFWIQTRCTKTLKVLKLRDTKILQLGFLDNSWIFAPVWGGLCGQFGSLLWAMDHCLLFLPNSSRNAIQSSVKINSQGPLLLNPKGLLRQNRAFDCSTDFSLNKCSGKKNHTWFSFFLQGQIGIQVALLCDTCNYKIVQKLFVIHSRINVWHTTKRNDSCLNLGGL